MTLPPFTVIVGQRGHGDCGIAALAILLGKPYDDVFEAAAHVARKPHSRGLWMAEIQRIARSLGVELKKRRKVNLEEDAGILGVGAGETSHVVVLRDGVILDPADSSIWFDPLMYVTAFLPLGTILRLED